jgi:hypothetical protein
LSDDLSDEEDDDSELADDPFDDEDADVEDELFDASRLSLR